MGRAVAWIHHLTRGRRWAWILFVMVWMVAGLVPASRLKVQEDLFAALPEDDTLKLYRSLLASGGMGGHVLLGFTAPTPDRMREAVDAADTAVQRLLADTSGLVAAAWSRPDPELALQAMDGVLEGLRLYADSAAVERMALADSLAVDSVVASVHAGLVSLSGGFTAERALRDPFGLAAPFLDRLARSGDRAGARIRDGVLVAADSATVLLLVTPTQAASTPEGKRALVHLLGQVMAQGSGDVRTAMFGAAPMAVVNAERIGADSRRTTLIAVVLIVLVLIWRYRRVSVPLLFLLPPAMGLVFALGVFAVVRGEVSGIALGACASLLGIALDYAFHFFTDLQHRRNMRATLEGIAAPMLTGWLTTMLAFAGLTLLGSRVLADLGLLAALMLSGAVFAVLVVLPHFAVVPAEVQALDAAAVQGRSRWDKLRPWRLPVVVVITLLLLPFAGRVRFEDDPERMSWMPPDMRGLRDRVAGTEEELRTVFIVGRGAGQEEARQALERAQDALARAGLDTGTGLFPTELSPSQRALAARSAHWTRAFGNGRGPRLQRWFKQAAERHGFRSDAFAPFTDQLTDTAQAAARAVLLPTGPLDGALPVEDGRSAVAGWLRVPGVDVERIEQALAASPDVQVLHRGVLGSRISTLVGRDLSTILLLTSSLVLLTLLITYGRIELALLTFIPMALGWTWILGICGLTGIAFNLVNIIVCTFIFGLGDDYCIFTTEGLLARYRDGSDHGRANRTAVLLSALTTIIGVGALGFAVHPALRSIAVVAVVGMVVLLVISLTVQPALFAAIIGDRARKGRYPFTLSSFLISAFAFLYFLCGCILLMVLYVVFRLLPFAAEPKKRAFHSTIMAFTRSLVYVMVNVRKEVHGFAAAIAERPAIVIANHASFIDILAMLMVSPKVVMLTNRWVWRSPFFGAIVRYAGFLCSDDDIRTNTERARAAMAQGCSVVIFPEGTRSRDGRIGRFHKGAFQLAEDLRAPIVPVVLHGFGHAMAKGDWMLKNARISMHTLPAIAWDDPRFGTGRVERAKRIAAWFRGEHERIRAARETPRYFRQQVVANYLYKGPVLEWYVRTKLRMDEGLHSLIHERIPRDARVVDLGCGHGMVAYLLRFCAPGRTVLGVDHDAEKVAVARHCFSRDAVIDFAQADLARYTPAPADAFVLKDVLHYLPPTEQEGLLDRCVAQLAAGGRIFVRDGFHADTDRHARTRRTERISTGIGFNRAEHALHFPEKAWIDGFARRHGLGVEWVQASARTSNELVVLSKP